MSVRRATDKAKYSMQPEMAYDYFTTHLPGSIAFEDPYHRGYNGVFGPDIERVVLWLGPDSSSKALGNSAEEDEDLPELLSYGEIPVHQLANAEDFRNEFFEVKKSSLGGNGAFATRDLKQGELIHVERPCLEAIPETLSKKLDQLAPELKAAFFRMHAHKRYADHDEQQSIFHTNR